MGNTTIEKMKNLQLGQSMVYYTSHDTPISNAAFDDRDIRNYAYGGYLAGTYELTQRLVNSVGQYGVFDYICTRRREPISPEALAQRRYYNRTLAEKSDKIRGEKYSMYFKTAKSASGKIAGKNGGLNG